MNGWISVLDQMPQHGSKVLVFGKDGMNVLSYDGHSIRKGMFWWDSHSCMIAGITHWMALPPPPERTGAEP